MIGQGSRHHHLEGTQRWAIFANNWTTDDCVCHLPVAHAAASANNWTVKVCVCVWTTARLTAWPYLPVKLLHGLLFQLACLLQALKDVLADGSLPAAGSPAKPAHATLHVSCSL